MLEDYFTVMIQLIEHAVGNVHVEFVADQVLNRGSGFILVRPVIHLRNALFDLFQQIYGKMLDLLDVALRQAIGEQQVIIIRFLLIISLTPPRDSDIDTMSESLFLHIFDCAIASQS